MRRNKTEITIETDRVFVIRRPASVILAWCDACGHESKMCTPEEVVAMAGVSSRAIYRAVEAGRVHFNETEEGPLLLCLASLGITDGDRQATSTPARQSGPRPIARFAARAGGSRGRESLHTPERTAAERRMAAPEAPVETKPGGDKAALTPPLKKDWTLTAEAFDRLLACLDADRDRAGLRYENIRSKLIKYFEYRACLLPDDLADETINRVARRILDGKQIWTSAPVNYFYGVARNVMREYWSSPERESPPVRSLPPLAHPYEGAAGREAIEHERWLTEKLLELLDECMQKLSPENRELIILYYQGEKGNKIQNRKDLARRMGIPPNALRIRVHRIREKLEKDVRERLNQMPAMRNEI